MGPRHDNATAPSNGHGRHKATIGTRWSSIVVVLLFVTFAIGLPLLRGRVLAGHDIVVYLINAQQTAENIRSGQFFPAWGGGFNAGFGAPTLVFFPPLTSYVHALPILVGVPVVVGVSMWSMAGLFLSGLAMAGWLRTWAACRAVLPAAVVYMASSYRLVDLYHRSALAEHWAFVFPPAILWAATFHRLRAPVRAALVAVGVAGLLLANIPLATFFGFGLSIWFLTSRSLDGRRVTVASGSVIGFGVAAFALVPQALSSTLLSVDRFYGPKAGRFRPSANTLFSGSVESWDFNTQVSTAVVALLTIVIIGFLLLPSERRRKTGAIAVVVVAAVCVLAATHPAGVVWDALPLLSKFQFPWRLAALLTFAAATTVARLDPSRAWLMVGIALVLSTPFVGWDRTRPMGLFSTAEPLRTTAGSVFPDPHRAWEAGSGGWYWRHHSLAEIWFRAASVRSGFLAELAGERVPRFDEIRGRPAVVRSDPTAEVSVVAWASTRREIEVDVRQPSTLLWRVIAFPGMEIEVDGRPVSSSADPSTGMLAHPVPEGRHRVTWSWQPFPALRWARRASIASMLAVGFLLLLSVIIRVRRIAVSTIPIRFQTNRGG